MSFAATMATERVATRICSRDPFVFMHGPTFMGNPLACAVANASVGLIQEYDLEKTVGAIETGIAACCIISECGGCPGIGGHRGNRNERTGEYGCPSSQVR